MVDARDMNPASTTSAVSTVSTESVVNEVNEENVVNAMPEVTTMTTEAKPRIEKRSPPRFDYSGADWKLIFTGLIGVVWAAAWLSIAKPSESIARTDANPMVSAPSSTARGAFAAGNPANPVATSTSPSRLATAAPAKRSRPAVRVRTRAS